MTLLLDDAALERRRSDVARGAPLAPLADSLAAELEPVLPEPPWLPPQKARLTRRGGRCPREGTLLTFDPRSPRLHRCPECGTEHEDEAHYRWWIMGWQLWLAERAVHAAALHALRGDPRHRAFAREVLARWCDVYASYPNQDNVLGPSRPFFSTYLESIWLLQLCVATSLLEHAGTLGALGGAVRERVIAPSATLIAGYPEGRSNRQVWNTAALLAARLLLGDRAGALAAIEGRDGLLALLRDGLLADGSWYEGENYHQFAHRGLAYGVTMAEVAGLAELPAPLGRRFADGFALPFRTALPDLTFPARRDSQYAVSLRQWRFAEMAELGLARTPGDERLVAALALLYSGDVPRGDTGRWRSTAEAERNEPASALARVDLGWRSLLGALPALPPLTAAVPRSELLAGQGLAVLRRDRGRVYVALDYGHSGGGHGHPDRLNVLLCDGTARWLDDPGTGSYVDRSLFWYRSTLAHNAPLVDGRSQRQVHGTLRAWEEHGDVGWVDAEVRGAAPGVTLYRTLVVMPGYALDELRWDAARDAAVDLPLHVAADVRGASWTPAVPAGGGEDSDGFPFLRDAERAAWPEPVARLSGSEGVRQLDAWVHASAPAEWWRAVAPGPPGHGARSFLFVRARGRVGRVVTVWSWRGAVCGVAAADDAVMVHMGDGARHAHRRVARGWSVELEQAGERVSLALGGVVGRPGDMPDDAGATSPGSRRPPVPLAAGHQRTWTLGPESYRRSESTWEEAGRPAAEVTVAVRGESLLLTTAVRKAPDFRSARAENELDNEHPDVNSDGVQLHLEIDRPPAEPAAASWLLVPEAHGTVRAATRGHADEISLHADWEPDAGGWRMRAELPLAALRALAGSAAVPLHLRLGVVVNEIVPGRERRRGQLVLGGAEGEFVYLQGDRLDPGRLVPFVITDV